MSNWRGPPNVDSCNICTVPLRRMLEPGRVFNHCTGNRVCRVGSAWESYHVQYSKIIYIALSLYSHCYLWSEVSTLVMTSFS